MVEKSVDDLLRDSGAVILHGKGNAILPLFPKEADHPPAQQMGDTVDHGIFQQGCRISLGRSIVHHALGASRIKTNSLSPYRILLIYMYWSICLSSSRTGSSSLPLTLARIRLARAVTVFFHILRPVLIHQAVDAVQRIINKMGLICA